MRDHIKDIFHYNNNARFTIGNSNLMRNTNLSCILTEKH